jgi:heptosyltransferase-2
MKYLIIRLTSLGDVVLATPAARAIKKAQPDATVHFLVDKQYHQLLSLSPSIDEVIPYDKKGAERGVGGMLKVAGRLREEKYDVVVDLQHKVRSIIISGLSGAVGKVVMRKRTLGGGIAKLAGIANPIQSQHTVDMYMSVLARIDIPPNGRLPELRLDHSAGSRARDLIEMHRRDVGPVIGFNVGAGKACKKIPVSTIREAAVALQKEGFGIVLVGARTDSGAIYNISSSLERSPLLNAHNYSLQELASAIANLDVLVSPDSGPVHLASAFGTPTIAVYGPTSPLRWGPLQERHHVIWHRPPCSPCSNHGEAGCPANLDLQCMRSVHASEIVDAARRLIAR